MPETLIVPLVLATVFTAGGVLIQRMERHAERITGVLGVVLLLCSFLDILAVFSRLAEPGQNVEPRAEASHMVVKQPPRPVTKSELARAG